MSTLEFVRQAGAACEEAEAAASDGAEDLAIQLFTKALHLYNKALQLEKNIEGQAMILRQTKVIRLRISELDGTGEAGEQKPRKKAVPVARKTGEEGDGNQFHEELRALRLSGSQLGELAWDDVIGLEDVKHQLLLSTKVPLELPHLFVGTMATSHGLLMYGPPGVGKTRLMKALARQSGMSFLAVSAADIVSKYVGESGRLMKALFEVAREQRPCIVFMDEIEGLCGSRESAGESNELKRAVGVLLQELDGVRDGQMAGLLFVGATNLPWLLDGGILRRMPARYYVPLPDHEARAALLQYYCRHLPPSYGAGLSADEAWLLASDMEHMSGADIASVVKTAFLATVTQLQQATQFRGLVCDDGERIVVPAVEPGANVIACTYENFKNKAVLRPLAVCEENIRQAMSLVGHSVTLTTLAQYEQWTAEHGRKSEQRGDVAAAGLT